MTVHRMNPCTIPLKTFAWVDSSYYALVDPQGHCDASIATCLDNHVTDIAASVSISSTSKFAGKSTLCSVTSTRIGSLTPFEYLLQQAHIYGIRVHAMFLINNFAKWVALLLSPWADNSTYHNTTNGGNGIQYATTQVRSDITAVVVDFIAQNPGIDGICLDYIRSDGVVTQNASDISLLVESIHDAISLPLSVCLIPDYSSGLATFKQDAVSWYTDGHVETFLLMSYSEGDSSAKYLVDKLTGIDPMRVYYGTSSQNVTVALSTFKGMIYRRYRRRMNQAYFATFWNIPLGNMDYIGDLYEGILVPIQDPITKIRVTPTVDFSVTIEGVVYTETYANVAAHTTPDALQSHMETIIGKEQPYLIFDRYTSSTIEIDAGDISARYY